MVIHLLSLSRLFFLPLFRFLLDLSKVGWRQSRPPGRFPESEPGDWHLPEQDSLVVETEPDTEDPGRAAPQEELCHAHEQGHHQHANEECQGEDAVHDGDVDEVVEHDDRRGNRHEQTHVEAQRHERLLLPHVTRCDDGFSEPRALPAHLLAQEHLMRVWHDGHANSCILIRRAMMAQDEIRHATVIAERRALAEEFLVEPIVTVLENEVLAIARKRPRKACDGIEIALCCFHDAEGYVIADGLHLRQRIRVGIRDIRASRDAAHLLVLERLHDVADGIGIEETVRVDKD